MKKLLSLLILAAVIFSFASCSEKSDAPDGMQLVRGGEDVGYYFYAPEEWTLSSLGNISAAYASNVDTTSISYVETDMPDMTLDEYVEKSLSEFTFDTTVVYGLTETSFANAQSAASIVYDYSYAEHDFRTKQIFTTFEGRFGIFTFTSFRENRSSGELIQYDYYKDKLTAVIDNFKYVTKSGSETMPEYAFSSDGFALVSDPKIAKFALYLTDDFTVDYSSGITSATLPDGSNINLSRASGIGVSVGTYFDIRLEELGELTSDLKVIEFTDEDGEIKTVNGKAKLGNANAAASHEYTFVYNNETYHVYQVCAVTVFDGFVFTYTAKEENYYKHIELIEKIAERIEF